MPNPLESALPALFVGVVLEVILAIGLVATGRGKYLIGMGIVLAGVLVALLVERLVVTEPERVMAVMEEARAATQDNDLDRLLGCIDPSFLTARSLAKNALDRVRFEDVRLRAMEVKVNRLTSPPTAKAQFTALAAFKDRRGEVAIDHYVCELTVTLRKKGQLWRITEVEEKKFGPLSALKGP